MFDLTGRSALVTGASRGIGRAIARQLADQGAAVAINYRESEAQARNVQVEIESAGGRAIIAQGDVSVPEDAERIVQTTGDAFGQVDILVNNAGFNRDTLILRMSPEDWDQVMAVNLRAVFLSTKATLRTMLRNRWGRIINIGSVSGLAGNAGQANYAAAKAGLIGFTKAVAREMGARGVTANLIAPGLIKTELTKDVSQEIVEMAMQRIVLKRVGEANDVASAVVFLASDEASYITGQVLSVDGGLGM
ncbi:MAG: 3-oxoacyl-[acyl-carrier-protein] reductase [Dehalococcoidia bacterium]